MTLPLPLPLPTPMRLAIVGAGPAGLTLALLAARLLPQAQISLFDARPLDRDEHAHLNSHFRRVDGIQISTE